MIIEDRALHASVLDRWRYLIPYLIVQNNNKKGKIRAKRKPIEPALPQVVTRTLVRFLRRLKMLIIYAGVASLFSRYFLRAS